MAKTYFRIQSDFIEHRLPTRNVGRASVSNETMEMRQSVGQGWIRAVLFRQPTVFASVKPSDTTGDHALDATWAGSASLRHYPRP